MTKSQLDPCDGVITRCTVVIAETSTIILQHGLEKGPRRLTLLPDFHLCVVLPDQLVRSVPEAFAKWKATSKLPLTFIPGPSAMADTEMMHIRGVHGPPNLEVICATDSIKENESEGAQPT